MDCDYFLALGWLNKSRWPSRGSTLCAIKTLIIVLSSIAFAIVGTAEGQGKSAGASSSSETSQTASSKTLPRVFSSALSEIKAKSGVPVLLPSELPKQFAGAQYARVGNAAASGYTIELYYKLGIGDAGLAASFSAQPKPNFGLSELPNVRSVNLAHGISGFFRAVSCGGSCAPANLWWEQNGTLYQVQLKSLAGSEADQEKSITGIADSAINAGPR